MQRPLQVSPLELYSGDLFPSLPGCALQYPKTKSPAIFARANFFRLTAKRASPTRNPPRGPEVVGRLGCTAGQQDGEAREYARPSGCDEAVTI